MKVPPGYPGGKSEYKATIQALKRCHKKLIKNPHEARDIDFWCTFSEKASAEQFLSNARQAGFSSLTLTEPDDEYPDYLVCVVVRVPLELDEIVRTEIRMHELVRPTGGKYDGWGTFSDDP